MLHASGRIAKWLRRWMVHLQQQKWMACLLGGSIDRTAPHGDEVVLKESIGFVEKSPSSCLVLSLCGSGVPSGPSVVLARESVLLVSLQS